MLSSMGRHPEHVAPDQTRDRILSAAIDVFAELGYEGASLRIIGRRARLNPAAVSYYFENKQRLWLAANAEVSRGLLTAAMSSIQPGRPAREAANVFLGELFDAFVANPQPARLMIWGALQAGQHDFDRMLDVFQPIITIGVGYFEAAQRAGQLPADIDVPVVLPQVFGLFTYTFIAQHGQRRHFGADLSDPAFAVRMRKALLAGAERLLGLDRPVRPIRPAQRRAQRA
jgi:AcrR family transcriptional regulator